MEEFLFVFIVGGAGGTSAAGDAHPWPTPDPGFFPHETNFDLLTTLSAFHNTCDVRSGPAKLERVPAS